MTVGTEEVETRRAGRKKVGTTLGLVALVVAAVTVMLWFRQINQVDIPENRTAFVVFFLTSVALGIGAFVAGTRWFGGVAACLDGLRGTRLCWPRRQMDGGTCEATVFQIFGHPSAALCVALGNYHNMGPRGRIAAETIRLSDLVGLARLLEAMLRDDRHAPRPGARKPRAAP